MDASTLRAENRVFRDTRGVSSNNRQSGFKPAFLDKQSGRVEVARLKNGLPAPVHIIGWLPREWAAATTRDGTIIRLVPDIIAGFVRDGVFYTREQAAEL